MGADPIRRAPIHPPLYEAVVRSEFDSVRALLSEGHDPNELSIGGDSPLRLAASRGATGIMRLLIDGGADCDAADRTGVRALHRAAGNGEADAIRILIERGADARALADDGRSPLHLAVARACRTCAAILLDAGVPVDPRDAQGKTPLRLLSEHLAPHRQHVEMASFLLAAGADVNAADATGKTALHVAAWQPELVGVLLAAGASVDARDHDGCTPLHRAASAASGVCDRTAATVNRLLQAGADVTAVDRSGNTPLRLAVGSGHVDAVRLLVPRQPDWQERRAEQPPLIHLALKHLGHSQSGGMAFLLLDLGADPNTPGPGGVRPLHRVINNPDAVQRFLQRGADPGAADDAGRTPLHVAADQRRTDVVQWLLDAGAAPSPADANGETPLHRLAVSSTPELESGGLAELEHYERACAIAELLVDRGAHVNAPDHRGRTPLHHAAQAGHEPLAETLLRCGADAARTDGDGRTALDVARPAVRALMGGGEVGVERFPASFVTAMTRRVAQALGSLRVAARPTRLERSTNCWIVADEFLSAFPTLRLDDGFRLACIFTCRESERQSRLIAVRLPADELLPELPVALREHNISTFLREVETPAELPDWVRWDVGPCIRDDGSAQGMFERALFHLWISQALNSGHNVYWGRARVLAEPAEVVRREQASGRLRPSYNGTKVLGLPEDLTPRVRRHITGDRAAEFLPDDPAGRARLASSPEFSLVEFYSYTAYVQRTVYRHRLWFVGGECIGGTLDAVADLGAGYVV